MIYHHLFEKFSKKQEVIAAYIGTGHFGTAVVSQQNYVKNLKIPVVGDKSKEAAANAFIQAGIPQEKIVYCTDAVEAEKQIGQGNYVYTDNCNMIMDIKCIDIICEGTGAPEAGARYCMDAIKKGKHIALVSKELDSAVGPMIKKEAQRHGVLYTPVDGDQHGLLMQLVEWARLIGLTVICAGKSRDGEFVYDEEKQTVTILKDGITVHETKIASVPDDVVPYFKMIPEGADPREYINKREEVLKELPGAGAFDLCEMVIAANSTGLKPPKESASLTQGSLRITELPIAYCNKSNHGIYEEEGVIDVYTCLRRYDEAGMGGGVFLVVKCDNAYSNYILTTKGQIPNYDLSTAVIYRPYHLCGVEVSTTLLSAVKLGVDTGSLEYKPDYDLIKKAAVDIECGEILGNDHDLRMEAMILKARAKGMDIPVPAHMLNGCKTVCKIMAGQTITYSMIEAPKDFVLWELRAKMETEFGLK